MNLYATLDDLKALLDVSKAEDNAQLFRLLEAMSRQIERPKLTGRYFYCFEGTRYFDGASTKLWLPDDILSITALKTDEDGDATYENTLAATDYFLYPLNEYPKTRIEINPNGDYSNLAAGVRKGVEIAGVFGWADDSTPFEEKTALSGALNGSDTNFDVSAGSALKVGQTLRIDSEQMFINAIANNKVYVERPVNGTTAATHEDAAAVSVYYYPEDISQAVLIMAMRAWKRKDSAFQDMVGSPETGHLVASKGIDPDVIQMVEPFRRQEYV